VSGVGIPVVDLAPFRTGGPSEKDRVAAELDTAYRDVGFASIARGPHAVGGHPAVLAPDR
jgi:isopenicillin N synthase-like dioxygenase